KFSKAPRGDEIVTPSCNGGDVAIAALAIAQGTAQGADLDLQVRVFDEGFRPGSGYQFFLADNLAGAFEQRRKDVKGTAAEAHRLVAFKQQPLRRKESVRAKGDRGAAAGCRVRLSRDGHRPIRPEAVSRRSDRQCR